ncbi:MAG: ABC transporter ATP-binding protein [Pirellulales bacterium]
MLFSPSHRPALEPSEPTNAVLIRRMLAFGWRYRWGCVQLVLLQLVLTALSLGCLALSGIGIDLIRFHAGAATGSPPGVWGLTPPADWAPLAVVSAIAATVLVLALARALLSYYYTIATARLVQGQIVVDLRSQVYDKLQRLGWRFFAGNSTSSVINRVTGDVQSVRMFVDGVIIQLVVVLLSLAFYLGYMLSIHPGLTIACLATTPLLWTVSAAFSRLVRPAYDYNRELVDRMILTLVENVQGVQVVKGFARENEETAKFQAANRAVKDQQQWIFQAVSLYTPSIGFLTQVNLFILLAYGGYLVATDALALGTGLIVFAGLLQQFSSQVGNIANIANSVQQSLTGARRVFEILDAPIEIQSPARAVRLTKMAGGVRFDRVSFEHRPGERVLQDIDLEVKPGQCVAVLGATGSGKSTLLNLIPRFHDPSAGRVLVDGIDVRHVDLEDLRRGMGLVFQESFLFSNTVAANIAFGRPRASRSQIEQAARRAAAHEFIMRLPDGYDTALCEGGSNLSGGQRQRLAIARALLLEPSILLLDDPMASIDPGTEHEILDAMVQALEGRTTFVVAHRLSTLRRADLVIVLDKGRIVQRGTHRQLLNEGGHYRATARLQGVFDESGMEFDTVAPGVGVP